MYKILERTFVQQPAAGHFTEMGTVVHGPAFVHSGPTYGREGMLRGGGRRERGGEGVGGGHLEGEGGAERGELEGEERVGAGLWEGGEEGRNCVLEVRA